MTYSALRSREHCTVCYPEIITKVIGDVCVEIIVPQGMTATRKGCSEKPTNTSLPFILLTKNKRLEIQTND